jgi:hypothetical protein
MSLWKNLKIIERERLDQLEEIERLARIVRKGAIDERCLFCDVRGLAPGKHQDQCPWALLDKALGEG